MFNFKYEMTIMLLIILSMFKYIYESYYFITVNINFKFNNNFLHYNVCYFSCINIIYRFKSFSKQFLNYKTTNIIVNNSCIMNIQVPTFC